MKKTILTVSLILMGCMGGMNAQISLVNPVPQVVKSAQELYNAPEEWRIVCDDARTDGIAAAALKTAGRTLNNDAAFTVTLGVRGDKAVRKYKKQIPQKAEGYYMELTPDGAVIAAYDEQGLYYGVQTLLGSMAQGKIESCTVTDWPDVKYRGVVEGFYGTPWSHEARLSQFDFYGRNKMNVYIYGPKDDPYHRDHWRTPYPAEEGKRIQELAEYAKQHGVNFYWAIHPGVDIKWTTEDRDALMAKLEQVYSLGVRSFAVFFDDIWGEGKRADKQTELLNYIDNNFIQKKKDVAPLIMCPTEYNKAWANDETGYLRTLGTQMNKSIEIMWTGNSVVHCIDQESMDWINQRIDRKAYIWWNFPVSDFVRDHILLGPAYGNGLDIADDVSGFVSNPMEHAEASKIALYGIADYTWNMEAYDYKANWEKAIVDLLPSNPKALRTFALYNKDLGPNGHGFNREEGDELKQLAQEVMNNDNRKTYLFYKHCADLKASADILLADRTNPELIRELRPWLLQARNLADYGMAVCNMAIMRSAKLGEYPTFTDFYAQARSLQEQMYQLENSDERHALQPGIKVGTKVMLPTIDKLFTQSVELYNQTKGTKLSSVAGYSPYKLTSNVEQLALLPVTASSNTVNVSPALEVIYWQADGELVIESENEMTLQGMEFNLGVKDMAKNFTLELYVDGEWKPVSILHYKPEDTAIHTGNELAGMKATKIRLTNTSERDLEVYFKKFSFTKQ